MQSRLPLHCRRIHLGRQSERQLRKRWDCSLGDQRRWPNHWHVLRASGCGSFIYYRNKYYPITYPGATATLANGINGDAMTAGYVGGITSGYTWTGFTESPIPPSWTGSFSSFYD